MSKRIAIIGAGPAGLVSAKSCIEAGLNPVIFEKSHQIGGIWGQGCTAWDGMHTNLSRWSCMFSDFPWNKSIQDFPTQREVLDYLKAYTARYIPENHIRFNTAVKNARRQDRGWVIETGQRTEKFDALIIASGFFNTPFMPSLPFQGHIIHSSQYAPNKIDLSKRTMVLGGSFSAYELAAEFARVSQQPVYHQFRHPVWVLKRYFNSASGKYIPNDIASYIRAHREAGLSLSPLDRSSLKIEFFRKQFGNPGDVHPSLTVNQSASQSIYVTISDDYLDLVKSGKIIPICSDVFDGRDAENLVCATGYTSSLPFFDQDILGSLKYDQYDTFMPVLLHDTVWPERVDDLAFVGFYRGPFFAVMELQARWAAGVMANRIPVPTQHERMKGVRGAEKIRTHYPRQQFPYGDYVGLTDKLAKHIGCMPEIDLNSPYYDALLNQAVMPWHYRLRGPHANPEIARQIYQENPYLK